MNILRKFSLLRSLHFTYCRSASDISLQDCYRTLGLPPDSSFDMIREAYLNKVKMYHPDSGSATADQMKFADVDRAYKVIKTSFIEQENQHNEPEEELEKDFGIKHVTPQHRQYLNFEGIGMGTPSQRQAQYEQYRVHRAVDAVHQRKIEDLAAQTEDRLVFRNKQESKKHKISNAIDRLAEDLIQQAMAKGEFNNLKGIGKPLETRNSNPYIDTVTQKLNEMLITEGFQPEWITLQKEIRMDIEKIKNKLMKEKVKFGASTLNNKELAQWRAFLSTLEDEVKVLNEKIDNYNLKVPILSHQRVHFSLDRAAQKFIKQNS